MAPFLSLDEEGVEDSEKLEMKARGDLFKTDK